MPSPYIKKLSKETGKSVAELEKQWDKAKEITKDDFGVSENDFEDKHYAYATTIVKRLAGVKESVITVSDFITSGKSAIDFIAEVVQGGDFPQLDNQVLSKDEEDDDDIIDEAKKDGTEPDGTGPHGRGEGPGEGKADGSGMDQKEKKKEVVKIPPLNTLVAKAGYYTENGVMIETLDDKGLTHMLNFDSAEKAREAGLTIRDDQII